MAVNESDHVWRTSAAAMSAPRAHPPERISGPTVSGCRGARSRTTAGRVSYPHGVGHGTPTADMTASMVCGFEPSDHCVSLGPSDRPQPGRSSAPWALPQASAWRNARSVKDGSAQCHVTQPSADKGQRWSRAGDRPHWPVAWATDVPSGNSRHRSGLLHQALR